MADGRSDAESPGQAAAAGEGDRREKPAPAEKRLRRPLRVRLGEAEVAVYSVSCPEKLLRVVGISGDLPVAGEEAWGWVSSSAVRWGRARVAGGWDATFRWKAPFLWLEACSIEWGGIEARARGSLNLAGAPLFVLDVVVPPGRPAPLKAEAVGGVEVGVERLEGRARLGGRLMHPPAWQGELMVQGGGVNVGWRGEGRPLRFERGWIAAGMVGGNVRIADARLLGESLSVLGNGYVFADHRAMGVARVVAAPDVAEALTRAASRLWTIRRSERPWLAPLGTPDRRYRDFHVGGTIEDAKLELGAEEDWIPVDLAWDRMRSQVVGKAAERPPGAAGCHPDEAGFPAEP